MQQTDRMQNAQFETKTRFALSERQMFPLIMQLFVLRCVKVNPLINIQTVRYVKRVGVSPNHASFHILL